MAHGGMAIGMLVPSCVHACSYQNTTKDPCVEGVSRKERRQLSCINNLEHECVCALLVHFFI